MLLDAFKRFKRVSHYQELNKDYIKKFILNNKNKEDLSLDEETIMYFMFIICVLEW